jgi:creatinine amidohydrolase/Fe(II)-dependent formamide hydrolase-like protein
MSHSVSRRGFLSSLRGLMTVGATGMAASTATSARLYPQNSQSTPLPTASTGIAGHGYVHPQRVLLWENTRKEFREALQSGKIKAAIIPTGSTEQHNEHLALICDTACATLISQLAAVQLYPQVTVSTPCPLGYAPYHMARPGTLTLRRETFTAYVYDVIQSLKTHGLRTILVVNGHNGNHAPLLEKMPEWRKELGITLDSETYLAGYKDEQLAEFLTSYRLLREGKLDTIARRTGMSHASEIETSILMAAYPDRVRPFTMEEYDRAQLNYESNFSPEVRAYLEPFTKQGWPKGENPENARDRARQEQALFATKEKGERLITMATQFIANRVQQMIEATEKGIPWPAVG